MSSTSCLDGTLTLGLCTGACARAEGSNWRGRIGRRLLEGNEEVKYFVRPVMVFCFCVILPVTGSLWSGNIHDAVALWFSDQGSAEETYGPISTWNTHVVSNSLEHLFCGYDDEYWCGRSLGRWSKWCYRGSSGIYSRTYDSHIVESGTSLTPALLSHLTSSVFHPRVYC